MTPDEAVAAGILERVTAMLPDGAMDGAEVVGDWSGLRCGRGGGGGR